MLVFSTQLCELLPLWPILWFNSPLPSPCTVWISIPVLYTRTECVWGVGVWGSGPQTDKHLLQSPFTGQFCLDDDILHCLLWVLSFYGWRRPHFYELTIGEHCYRSAAERWLGPLHVAHARAACPSLQAKDNWQRGIDSLESTPGLIKRFGLKSLWL
jgi:hypothetical protein